MENEHFALAQGVILQSRYRIEAILGQGGFGITYRAVHIELQKQVAIKEFFMRGACEREVGTTQVTTTQSNRELADRFRGKFVKEARMIASLSHPNIVRVSDIFEANGTAYYVMDYVEGESLARRVEGCGALSELEALHYIRQVADALSYIHSRHMLHLDVKPANILLAEGGKAILIDFGVAKQYDVEGQQTSTTPTAVSKGYSPIEQYKQGAGVDSFTPATDVYALGATLYKLLTGVTPPESADLISGETTLAPYPGGVNNKVKEAIARSLRVRRERLQTVETFLELLQAVEKEEEKEVTRLMAEDVAPKNLREQRQYRWIGGVVVALGLVVWMGIKMLPSMGENTEIALVDSVGMIMPDTLVRELVSTDTDVVISEVVDISREEVVPAHKPELQAPVTSVRTKGKVTLAENASIIGSIASYEGELLDGVPDGYGVARYKSGDVYEGNWKAGLFHGQGTFYEWPEGTKYVGEWKNGKREGNGTQFIAKGPKYVGEWKNNRREGQGTMYLSSGQIYYVGGWKNDEYHGYGTQYNINGRIFYQGEHINGIPADSGQ